METDHNFTKKQRKFIEEYLKEDCPNQTVAAERAGYSTAASAAHANMNNDKVREEIEARFEKMAISRNELLFRLSQWARMNANEASKKNVSREVIGALKELTRKFDDFKDRKEVTVSKKEKQKELDRMLGYDDIEEEVVLEDTAEASQGES